MTLCLNSSGWKRKFRPKGRQSKTVKTPVCLHSCQVPEDLPGQCPLWGAPSFSYGILPAALLHFYKAFHMNKFTNKKKAFYQTLSLIQGKHSYLCCLLGSHVSGSPVPLCATGCSYSIFLPHPPHTPNRHKTEPRTIDFFLYMSVAL